MRPTELGTIVNDLLVEHFPDVVDIGFTAQIEEHLDQVAEGRTDWVPVVKEFYDPFAETLEKAASMMERVEIADEPSDEVCDVCGRPMVIKLGRFGKFLACSGFPECRNTRTLLNKIGVECPQCGGDLIERKTRTGRVFFGCSNYPTCSFSSWQRPVPQRCPDCGGLQTIRAKGKLVCTQCGRTGDLSETLEPEAGAEAAAVEAAPRRRRPCALPRARSPRNPSPSPAWSRSPCSRGPARPSRRGYSPQPRTHSSRPQPHTAPGCSGEAGQKSGAVPQL